MKNNFYSPGVRLLSRSMYTIHFQFVTVYFLPFYLCLIRPNAVLNSTWIPPQWRCPDPFTAPPPVRKNDELRPLRRLIHLCVPILMWFIHLFQSWLFHFIVWRIYYLIPWSHFSSWFIILYFTIILLYFFLLQWRSWLTLEMIMMAHYKISGIFSLSEVPN